MLLLTGLTVEKKMDKLTLRYLRGLSLSVKTMRVFFFSNFYIKKSEPLIFSCCFSLVSLISLLKKKMDKLTLRYLRGHSLSVKIVRVYSFPNFYIEKLTSHFSHEASHLSHC